LTLFHAAQIILALAVLALVVHRARVLCFVHALDGAAFRRALLGLIRADRSAEATELVREARPALAVEPVWALFDSAIPNEDRPLEVEERLMDVDARATSGLRALRICASVASAIGFIGAMIDIQWIHSEHGLLALEAGLVESIGLSRAFLSIALGIATSSFALGSWVVLRKQARTLVADARRILSTVEEALDQRKSVG
jgi:biopolymer transport protein ExbB/TolQ